MRLPNSFSQIAGYYLIGQGLLAMPFYVATVLYGIGISVFWVVFKDAKLPEDSQKVRQVPTQSSSLDGPEVER